MDANGTSFHLLLGERDWLGAGATVEPDGALAWSGSDHTLRLAEVPFEVPESEGNQRVGLADRRGAARDRYGHVYWVGPGHDEVLFQPSGTREVRRYWPHPPACDPVADGPADRHTPTDDFVEVAPEPVTPQRFAGLAVTDDHHLVVGVPDLPGVLVFDLHGGGPPITVPWPAPFAPLDMTPAPGGGVWVLDGSATAGPARYWRLDGSFHVVDLVGAADPVVADAPDFAPVAPDAESPPDGETATGEVSSAAAVGSPLPLATSWAVAIDALPDGSVLVLDRGAPSGTAVIARYLGDEPQGEAFVLPVTGGPPVDMAYLPGPGADGVAGTVFVVGEQGDQAIALALDADASELVRLHRYLPMRLFSGKALVAGGGRVSYDLGDWWLPLVDRRSVRYRSAATLTVGAPDPDLPGVFDAGEPGTVWHRLAIDARIPAGTSVTVEARAADDPGALEQAGWTSQPDPYRRGGDSEVAYHRFGRADATDAGTFELLFQRTVGRLLQLRLTISGDGRRTPALWALRAHAPRFSYLEAYLPAIYREDPGSASFLDRYLANVEGLFTTIEGRIEHAQVLFGADTLGTDHLDWLATWLGVAFDAGWDEARVRLFLRHAVALYGRRGTAAGITQAVRLATEACPDSAIFDDATDPAFGVRIVEAFRTRSVPGVVFGDPGTHGGPRVVPREQRWKLEDGRAELDRRWRGFVTGCYAEVADIAEAWERAVGTSGGAFSEPFRPLEPTSAAEARVRSRFLADEVGVTYAEVGTQDLPRYRSFVEQRYRRIGELNDAWGRLGTARYPAFSHVPLPTTAVPSHERALQDWIQFVSAHLPAIRAAHRFTVLVPILPSDPDDVREDRVARVEQVVAAARPAHTAFEVRPYWAAFRVGQARVGHDSVVGEGSRFLAMVLGDGRLAAAHLSGRHPWDVTDRFVVGRERVPAAAPRAWRDTTDE